MAYSDDKDVFLKWLVGISCSGCFMFAGAIYSDVREFRDFMIYQKREAEYTKMEIEAGKKKDEEQDKKLDRYDKVLFDLPKRITLKYNEQQD